MNPILRRRSSAMSARLSLCILSPSKITSPLSGHSIPDRHFKRVDFPEPLLPVTATNSPSDASNETLSNAVVFAIVPYIFDIFSAFNISFIACPHSRYDYIYNNSQCCKN